MMNMGAGIIGQSLALVVSYIARRVFLDVLNADYLGVNNLFTNILSMLSLVEIGIGPLSSTVCTSPLPNMTPPRSRS